MELVGWIFASLFAIAGGVLCLAWHPSRWKRFLGLVPIVLFCVGMTGVFLSMGSIESMTQLYWAVFYLVIPIGAGFTGYWLASDAQHARQRRIYRQIKGGA